MPTCDSIYEAIYKLHRDMCDSMFITIVIYYITRS